MIWSVIDITALAGMGGTGMGGLLSCLFRKDSSKTVSLLLSFAAGVMTSVVCFDLLTEALHPDDLSNDVGLVVTGVLVGYVVIALLNALIDHKTNHEVAHIDENHPKTADSLEELTHANHLKEHREGRQPRSGLFLAGLVMAAAIALHNVPEGMVIGASFARTAGQTLLNRGGLTMAVVIGLHNIPEGMALGVVYAGFLSGSVQMSAMGALALSIGIAIQNFPEGAIVSMPMRAEGVQKSKAFLCGVLSGIVEPIGAVLTIVAASLILPALPYFLSFAAGAMIYVVIEELLPEASQGEHSNLGTLFFALGFSLMMVLDVALG